MASELRSLVDRGLVRVLDLVLLRKDVSGSVEVAELHELDAIDVGELGALEADLAMLLAEEDVEAFGEAIEPGSIAAALGGLLAAVGADAQDTEEERGPARSRRSTGETNDSGRRNRRGRQSPSRPSGRPARRSP
jgi:hypothetical protein